LILPVYSKLGFISGNEQVFYFICGRDATGGLDLAVDDEPGVIRI
jgi:hypothetical protein